MTYEENNFYRTNSIFIISLSAVSAADNTTIKTNDHTDNIKTDDITINLEKTSQSENNDGYKTYEEFKKAIETSKEGDTIKLGSNIKLKDTLNIKTNKITIDGQGHTIDGDKDYRIFYIPANYVTIQNLKLIDGDCDEGAAIYADKYLTVKKCEFTNNKASDRGGAIFNYNGNLDISDSMFKNNRASGTWGRDQYGGAIYCTNLKCNNCTFEDNYSNDDAGAIYIHDGDKTEIRNSKFIRNNAELSGGAISCVDVYCNNCTFENNYASNLGGAINGGYGAHVQNSRFKNNKAGDDGGAVYIDGGQGEISDSHFTNNQAKNGGAIYSSNIDCLRCYFENNHANDNGGALCQKVDGDLYVIHASHCKFIKNTAEIDGRAAYCGKIIVDSDLFLNNGATGAKINSCWGGAVFCLTMEGNKCIFENNYADDYGGATYIKTKSESTIKNTQFTNNQAKDNNGGAIYSNGDLRVSNCNFTKNKAKTDGGAIYADAKVTATSSIFIINEAAGTSSQCYAGAIYCTNIDCDKCIFDNNHAYDYGGAIYINNKGKSTIKNSKFTNNKADDYNGGAIYSKKNIEVYNSLFKNNQANNSWSPSTSQGGAIYCGTITCNNCTFENNKAKKYAGAIYINDKEVSTIKNSKFINNTSSFNGGAINANGKLIVESSIFKNNKADHFGGALEPYENGGAIFCLNIYCNNSTFENNYAESYGGAIFIKNEGKSTIKNSKFINNTAKLNGGAIYCASINCKNSTFKENYASQRGGAIHINNKGLSVIENSKFIDNEACQKGGAINIDDTSAHVVIKNNSFKGNTVDKEDGEGSIIYNYGHYDKISNNYYGTNNPDWKNALYEHKYFGLDVEHRDSNPVKL